MRLEYLGQYWNAETRRVHLVGTAPEPFAERFRLAGFSDVRYQPLTFGISMIHSGRRQ